MNNVKLLLLMFLLFFGVIGFAQNSVTYSSLSKTIDLNSGVEGTVDIIATCSGNSDTPVFLNALQSCANNDGILSTTYTNGSILYKGDKTTIRYKFKKTVTANTQIVYKFSTDGSCFQDESKMIKITVNYKASSTTPTNPTSPISPTWNYIAFNNGRNPIEITEGDPVPLIVSEDASLTLGKIYQTYTYSYQWYMRINDGTFVPIQGAKGMNYSPEKVYVKTEFRRTVIYIHNGFTSKNDSNLITVNVKPAQPILNNTITIDGKSVYGSSPTGGIGNYTYSWVVVDEDGDSSTLSYTSPEIMFSAPEFVNYLKSPKNFNLARVVFSGSQRLVSNFVLIPHISEIQNNTISTNNNQVTGSIPTGGIGEYNGDYTYSWVVVDEDGDSSTLSYTSPEIMFSAPEFVNYLKSPKNFNLARVVYSGNQRSVSNFVLIPHSLSSKIQNNIISINNSQVTTEISSTSNELSKESTLISGVYPNPTSGALNFTTSFSSNKEIEIIVYSEELGKTQSIFKGTTTPNQIVQCDIPSNYPKGIYYYKIVSDNKEVKTGKIIFQ